MKRLINQIFFYIGINIAAKFAANDEVKAALGAAIKEQEAQ
mgnify:CR=1 FL=1